MKSIKIIIQIIIFLTLTIRNIYSNKICNIYNDHYRGEFIYAASNSNKHNLLRRDIFTWHPVQDKNIVKHAKMGIMGFNQQDDQSIWELIPVENRMNTYLIRNVKYGEYLYASSFFRQLLVSNRRMVYTWKKSKHEMDGKDYYMWEMREPFVMMDHQKTSKSSFEPAKFTIWNVAYNEPLYAASRLFATNFRRSVFTFHKKPDDDKFNWFLVCK